MFQLPKQSISKLIIASFILFTNQIDAQSAIIEQEKEEVSTFTTADLIGKSNLKLTQGKEYKVLPEVAEQLEKMKIDAKKAGFDICVISSYRGYNYQNGIWERKFKANKAKGLSNIKNNC